MAFSRRRRLGSSSASFVTGVASGSTTYVSGVSYASSGSPAQIPFGLNGVLATENVAFDKGLTTIREQPTQITVTNSTGTILTLSYGYCPGTVSSCATNNGNLQTAGISTPTLNLSQSLATTF